MLWPMSLGSPPSCGFVLSYCNFSAALHSLTVMSGSWLCYVECDKKKSQQTKRCELHFQAMCKVDFSSIT